MLSAVVTIVVLSMAVAAAAMTITKAVVFGPVRDFVSDHSEFLGELINCPYCTSHWLALLGAAVFRPTITSVNIVCDVALVMFAVVTLASVFCGVIYLSLSRIPGPARRED